ncbi:hypothetical protein B0H66DRAFT_207691 [Apodospora peruviana]|uniref:Uncharacterized protein n=1 Tax=Apodospora peruviana TaxID=516989 RepID=A0AAE0ICG2_9PEZI|nr:hypothetical protein B0H66DRAFT_207691 [Apodospora peruviana]
MLPHYNPVSPAWRIAARGKDHCVIALPHSWTVRRSTTGRARGPCWRGGFRSSSSTREESPREKNLPSRVVLIGDLHAASAQMASIGFCRGCRVWTPREIGVRLGFFSLRARSTVNERTAVSKCPGPDDKAVAQLQRKRTNGATPAAVRPKGGDPERHDSQIGGSGSDAEKKASLYQSLPIDPFPVASPLLAFGNCSAICSVSNLSPSMPLAN